MAAGPRRLVDKLLGEARGGGINEWLVDEPCMAMWPMSGWHIGGESEWQMWKVTGSSAVRCSPMGVCSGCALSLGVLCERGPEES